MPSLVARDGELKATAKRRPVDCGNGGNGEVLESAERRAEVGKELRDLGLGHRVPLNEVGARTEGAECGQCLSTYRRSGALSMLGSATRSCPPDVQ